MKKFLVTITTAIILVTVVILTGDAPAQSATLNLDKTPRLANIFFRWDITEAEARTMAKWDILLVDMEVQHYSPNSLKLIRKYNPKIKILAYLASQEVRGDSHDLTGTLRKRLYDQINDRWWLRDTSGNKVYWWPGNPIFNVTGNCPKDDDGKRYSDFLGGFIKDEILSTGLWDGVFLDNVWEGIDFMSGFNIDLNQDGTGETQKELSASWKQGMTSLLNNVRQTLGPDYIMIGNGGEGYYKYLNGSLYEHFPYQGWAYTMNKYRFITQNGYSPAIGILNSNVGNSGKRTDYQKMRYGLASALLGDGFYSFDNGDQTHVEMWWYDEYESYLGRPTSVAINVANGGTKLTEGVWRRDYEKGVVLVNSTDKEYVVDLKAEYEKVHGTQDPKTNDGTFVSKVTLPAKDGLILLKTVAEIHDAPFSNGAFARIFDAYGHVKRSGFFAYLENYDGGYQTLVSDINNDGLLEILVATGSQVQIYDSKQKLVKAFYPYDKNFNQGINIAVGDLDNNGTKEIVTGTKNGGGPQVRIFNSTGILINPGFFAYAKTFRGGVHIAVGDVNGDGAAEIVTGAGVSGGPHVRIFDKDGKLSSTGFFAYDRGFRGGVNVAVGDLDNDGKAEIVTGPGAGGNPHVKIFNAKGELKLGQFYAYDQKNKDGVELAVTDIDGDGSLDVVGLSSNVFSLGN